MTVDVPSNMPREIRHPLISTDNEAIIEPMPTKREVDGPLAALFRTKEGTQGMTEEGLVHFNALKW